MKLSHSPLALCSRTALLIRPGGAGQDGARIQAPS